MNYNPEAPQIKKHNNTLNIVKWAQTERFDGSTSTVAVLKVLAAYGIRIHTLDTK